MNQKITEEHLRRRAIVYVRQSTPIQLIQNRESQIRQYGLAEHARNLGFVMWRPLTRTWGALDLDRKNGQDFSAWWQRYARGRSAPFYSSRPRVWHGTGGIGTNCSNSADWSERW